MADLRMGGFNFLPPAVKNILIINGLFFLATWVLGRQFDLDLTRYLGLHYVGSDHFGVWQFFTHVFMHGGFTHLFFNMFALWMFGSVLENVWGPKRFLVYYFTTALGAAALHMGVVSYGIISLENVISTYVANPRIEAFNQLIDGKISSGYLSIRMAINKEIFTFRELFASLYSEWSLVPESAAYASSSVQLLRKLDEVVKNIPTVWCIGRCIWFTTCIWCTLS